MSEEIFNLASRLSEKGDTYCRIVTDASGDVVSEGRKLTLDFGEINRLRVTSRLPDPRFNSQYLMLEVLEFGEPVYRAMEVVYAPGIPKKEKVSLTHENTVMYRSGCWEDKLSKCYIDILYPDEVLSDTK